MPFYETVFITRQDLSDSQVKALTDKFTKIIKDQGGKVHKVEQWGLRALAYRIKKNRKGHYTLIESDAPAEAVIELERVLRLEEDVLRALTIRENALSGGPSVMMDKGGRDRDDDDRNDKSSYRKKEEAA